MDKFDCLYVINKRAKQYLSQNNNQGKLRGKCLYKLKHRCINSWFDEFSRKEKHIIDGSSYYCFYKDDDLCFHIPESELIRDVDECKQKILTDFSSSLENKSSYTERECLKYLFDEYNYNPNNFLPDECKNENMWTYLT